MPGQASARRRWWLLAVLSTAYGAGAFGVQGVSPLSPFLLAAFHLTRVEVGLLLPSVYFAGLLLSLLTGRIADRLGARACLLGGLVIAGAMLLIAAGLPTFGALLGALVVAGVGWALVNPALGKAIIQLFPVRERGVAMGIKQMALTLGGVASALVLPPVAARMGWRLAFGLCAVVVLMPAALAWHPLSVFAAPPSSAVTATRSDGQDAWWWARRPPLLVLFASALGLAMTQSALLGYLPLFATQQLGLSVVAAGVLLAVAQAGGAVARVGLGLASDRSFGGRRTPWLVVTAACVALAFLLFASHPSLALAAIAAFAAGVGTLGWVGLFLVIGAEVGGHEQAGLLTGVAMTFIVGGILTGAPIFGVVLEASDSYAVAWGASAALALAVAVALTAAGRAIARERKED